MIAFAVRFIGLWFIAAAVVALVIDLTKSIAADSVILTPLSQTWFSIDHESLAAARDFVREHIEAYIGGWVWEPTIQWILSLPSWVVAGVLGAVLVYVGRRRRRHRYAY